jgi:hypothetical protein
MVLGGVMSLLAVSTIIASSAALPITRMASVSIPISSMAASAAALPITRMAGVSLSVPVDVVEEATGLVDTPLPVAVDNPWGGGVYLFSGLVDVPRGGGKDVNATAEYGRHTDEARGAGSHHDMHLFSGHGIDIHLVWRREILAHAYSKLSQLRLYVERLVWTPPTIFLRRGAGIDTTNYILASMSA